MIRITLQWFVFADLTVVSLEAISLVWNVIFFRLSFCFFRRILMWNWYRKKHLINRLILCGCQFCHSCQLRHFKMRETKMFMMNPIFPVLLIGKNREIGKIFSRKSGFYREIFSDYWKIGENFSVFHDFIGKIFRNFRKSGKLFSFNLILSEFFSQISRN